MLSIKEIRSLVEKVQDESLSWAEQVELRRSITSEVYKLLLQHGVDLDVWACGCCESPLVTLSINGEQVLDKMLFANIGPAIEESK